MGNYKAIPLSRFSKAQLIEGIARLSHENGLLINENYHLKDIIEIYSFEDIIMEEMMLE